MPTQPFHIVDRLHGKSLQEQVDYLTNELAKTQKTLRYLLNGGLDTENVNELNADVLNAGTVNTNLVKIFGALGNKFFQIDEQGMVANNGSQNVLDFDLETGNLSISGIITALAGMIGGWSIVGNALYSSTTTYPRVVIDPTTREITFYSDATRSVRLGAFGVSGTPFLQFVSPDAVHSVSQSDDALLFRGIVAFATALRVDFNNLINNATGSNFWDYYNTLMTAIGTKADIFVGYTGIRTVTTGSGSVENWQFENGILKYVY